MIIFVKNKGENNEPIRTEVMSISEDFSSFLMEKGEVVKTNGGRTFITVPYIFEKIDNSDVYIKRHVDTGYIEDNVVSELLSEFCDVYNESTATKK